MAFLWRLPRETSQLAPKRLTCVGSHLGITPVTEAVSKGRRPTELAGITQRHFRGPTAINLLHDPLCPLDRVINGADRCWDSRCSFVLREFPRCKDAGRNQQNALASLRPSIFRAMILMHEASARWCTVQSHPGTRAPRLPQVRSWDVLGHTAARGQKSAPETPAAYMAPQHSRLAHYCSRRAIAPIEHHHWRLRHQC